MDQNVIENYKTLFNDIKKTHAMKELALEEEFGANNAGDEIDETSRERERQLYLKLKGRNRFYLKKIDDALERINKGTFGECLECGCDIEEKRLEARPTATQCIGCKEEQEQAEAHVTYKKKSHTLGRTFSSKNVVELTNRDDDNSPLKKRVRLH